ncbi:MAG: hypothetical protein H7834_08220 [Magnetococcus sp. YQC-9]
MAIYGTPFKPLLTLKALCHFEDGNLMQLPEATRQRLTQAARAVQPHLLPTITPFNSNDPLR